jgi:hypothetical protein
VAEYCPEPPRSGDARILHPALAAGDEVAIAKLYGRAIEPTSDAAQVREAASAILEHGGGARPGSVQEFASAIARTRKSIADDTAALQKQSYVRDPQGRFVPGRRPSDPRLQVLQRQDNAVRAIEGAVSASSCSARSCPFVLTRA